MTEEERPRETDVPEGNDNLIRELETLYHKVAALDDPDLPPDNVIDFHAAYNILQIAPGASREEIQTAYEKLSEAWREGRYPQVPFWDEKAAYKRREVEQAYENLIKFHALRNKEMPPIAEAAPAPNLIDKPEVSDQKEIMGTPHAEDVVSTDKHSGRRWKIWFFFIGVPTLLIAAVAFFWPELYHYDTLTVSQRIFPLRIHRLTGDVAYHDGTGWRRPPLPEVTANPPIPAPATEESPSPPSQLMEMKITAPVPSTTSPIKDKKEIPAEKSSPGQKTYRIQIAAFPDTGSAAAEIGRLKNKYRHVSIEEVSIKGKGVWNRVLVGEFASLEEGRRFLRTEGLDRRYPGSFLRKANGS